MVLASFKNILIKCQTLTIETRISPNSFSSIKCFKCRPTTIFVMHLLQIQCRPLIFCESCYENVIVYVCEEEKKMLGKINKETADKQS